MTSFARRHAREITRGVVHLWWVFVIVMPLCGFVLFIAIDYANAKSARVQRHNNELVAYSINKSACGFRGFVQPTLKSYEAAAKDPTLSKSARARNDKRIRAARRFLETQVTIPADFDCSTLTNKPPKATS